jgi:hypothetical protein
MCNKKLIIAGFILAVLSAIPFASVQAVDLHGATAFADAVTSYNPVIAFSDPIFCSGGCPNSQYRGASNSLGQPNFNGQLCSDQATCTFVTVGPGGSLTLEFVANRLVGSGNSDLDLWIFEVAADVEATFVEISKDGVTYSSVGEVKGATTGVDIDAFGFGPSDQFRFVRVTDDACRNEGNGETVGGVAVCANPIAPVTLCGPTCGADIDAIGLISAVPANSVPEPTSLALFVTGLLGRFLFVRVFRKRL